MIRIFVALILLFGMVESALALRCGNKLVSEGDYIEEVRVRCGDPIAIDTYTILRDQRFSSSGHYRLIKHDNLHSDRAINHNIVTHTIQIEVFVEEWVYNFGPRRLLRRLHFENGILKDIDVFGYGYR